MVNGNASKIFVFIAIRCIEIVFFLLFFYLKGRDGMPLDEYRYDENISLNWKLKIKSFFLSIDEIYGVQLLMLV